MSADQYLARVAEVGDRLRRVAIDRPGLTEADPATGDQWSAGQAWGHISEFVPFWIEELGDVIDDFQGQPVPFGREPGETARKEAIDQGPDVAMDRHLHWLDNHVAQLEEFIRSIPEDGWKAEGLHRKMGVLSVPEMLDQFLVGHLEEHAAQLEKLSQ